MKRIIWLVLHVSVLARAVSSAEVPLRQRAIDVLILENDTRLLGVSLSPPKSRETRFLMRGAWLQDNAPNLMATIKEQATKANSIEQESALIGMLSSYVQKFRTNHPDNAEHAGYLQERLDGLLSAGKLPVEQAVPDVVILRLASTQIRRQLRQSDHVRRLAGLAILNQFDDCEKLSQADLQVQLQKVGLSQLRQDLPGESHPSQVADDKAENLARQQFVRILLDADRIFGSTCRLILQSGQYLKNDQSSAVDLQQLTAQMLTGQIQSQLQDLLNEGGGTLGPAAPQKPVAGKLSSLLNPVAAAIADREHANVVEVTQMQMNPSAGSASVLIDVYYRLPGETSWKLTIQVTGAATSRDISVAQKQRIANDPQVQQITQLFGGLGSSGADLTKAISIGACVETAQTRAAEKLTQALKAGLPNNSQAGISVVEAAVSDVPVEDEKPRDR